MTELQNKVRELGARRTLNQKRVGDANLATHRAKVAQNKLEVERDKMRYFWGDGIEAASRTKEIEAENAQLVEQLRTKQAELEAQLKMRLS